MQWIFNMCKVHDCIVYFFTKLQNCNRHDHIDLQNRLYIIMISIVVFWKVKVCTGMVCDCIDFKHRYKVHIIMITIIVYTQEKSVEYLTYYV